MSYIFHNIGTNPHPNYHTVEQVLNCPGFLTFDGVYLNVYAHRHLLKGRHVTLYFMGDYVGEDNSFDQKKPKPLERLCTMAQLTELAFMGCILGWHTWSHPHLIQLSDDDLKREVEPPFPMDWFCYPYGEFDNRVIEAVKEAGFKYAHTVFAGDNTAYQQTRKMM